MERTKPASFEAGFVLDIWYPTIQNKIDLEGVRVAVPGLGRCCFVEYS